MIVSCAVTQTKMMAKCNKRGKKNQKQFFIKRVFYYRCRSILYIYHAFVVVFDSLVHRRVAAAVAMTSTN